MTVPVVHAAHHRRVRRPRLSRVLAEARKGGEHVKSATVEADGKITLTFGDGEPANTTTTNEWDERLNRDKH